MSVALVRNPMFITGALPKSVYPPLFNRYGGQTNAFGMHVDNAVRTHAATAKHVRTDISCTLFLSDPASYDGGELVVQDTYGEQRIKFDAGDLVMYPGTSVHRVEPVTRGGRLACFFWIESMVRLDAQRRLLYDMDLSITALRQKDWNNRQGDPQDAHRPESPEVVRLTGCHHNCCECGQMFDADMKAKDAFAIKTIALYEHKRWRGAGFIPHADTRNWTAPH